MSENVEKKRENGYYWVRTDGGKPFIVRLTDALVFEAGSEDYWLRSNFERLYVFLEGPLMPPEGAMKGGFYWIRDRRSRTGKVRIVEVRGDEAFPGDFGKVVSLVSLKRDAEFLSKEPLAPPETP